MITLFEFRSSPYCEKARLALDLKGLDYQAVEINGLTRAELRGISTYPTVPILKDGDRVVEDSTAIFTYLDEKQPEPRLWPDDPAQRREAQLWEDWADESWGYAARAIGLWALRGDYDRLRREVTRNLPSWADAVWPALGPIAMKLALNISGITAKNEPQRRAQLESGFRLLADALEGREWLVGDAMSAADVAIAGHLWELRHTDRYEHDAACAPVFALRDRVYAVATASRVSKA